MPCEIYWCRWRIRFLGSWSWRVGLAVRSGVVPYVVVPFLATTAVSVGVWCVVFAAVLESLRRK